MANISKDTLIHDVADAYRTASGTTEAVKAGELAQKISELSGGDLPVLDNPAAVTDVANGKEYIDENGQKQTGTKVIPFDWTSRMTYISTSYGIFCDADLSDLGQNLIFDFPNVNNYSSLFYNTKFAENVNIQIKALSATSMQTMFRSITTPVDTVEIFFTDKLRNLNTAFNGIASRKKIILHGSTKNVTSFSYAFRAGGRNTFTAIEGDPIDFSSNTGALYGSNSPFYECYGLSYCRFVPNTLADTMPDATISIISTIFDKDTMISFANCLIAGTGTATLSSAQKTICNGTMGTVSQVTEGDVTYDFFTADDSGTITLMSFITQTKGWTVA